MPLIGIPNSITPELLYALARMGHGDTIVIADANFPSDSIANNSVIKLPIRVKGTTSKILKDILTLIPLDTYSPSPIQVMDRVDSDKASNLYVPAYELLANASNVNINSLTYVERFEFYKQAKNSFCVIQTDDSTLYANVIVSKGVI